MGVVQLKMNNNFDMKTPKKRLEDVAIDHSKWYERKRRASEKEYRKFIHKEVQQSEMKYNSAGIWINQDIKPRKYIVVSRKFYGVSAAACPCVGQVATNSKLLAYFLYHRWNRFSRKNFNGYTIAVMLMKRVQSTDPHITDRYEAIKR